MRKTELQFCASTKPGVRRRFSIATACSMSTAVMSIGSTSWNGSTAPLNRAGYIVIVVTNQSGIARGFYDEAAVRQFHTHMQDGLQAQGAHIDAFYYCPHHPQGTVAEWAVRCRCRKPLPGMLEQAARDWPIDHGRSFMIGDKDDDMAAAAAFNIPGIKFDAATEPLIDLVRREIAARPAGAV
jgi:D-glycero-D-manno-heptose 1,7-bisphosphate phosphatase